jgi:hypothetical protein
MLCSALIDRERDWFAVPFIEFDPGGLDGLHASARPKPVRRTVGERLSAKRLLEAPDRVPADRSGDRVVSSQMVRLGNHDGSREMMIMHRGDVLGAMA